MFFIAFSELCFLTDIVLGFFKQEINEEGKSQFEPLEIVATNYLKSSSFKIDLIAFIPWGILFGLIDQRLIFMWVIKAIRIFQLNSRFTDRQILPIINRLIVSRQLVYLKDPILRSDKESDYTFIKAKIYITNIMKILRLVLQILFISFFMGQYWYIFSQTFHEFKFSEPAEQF